MEHVLQMAVGTAQPSVDHRPMLWALLAALEQRDLHSQVFLSRSHFVCANGAIAITGQDYRHLDSWLMSPDLCRQLFAFGIRSCDAAVVEGQFGNAEPPGGNLDALCEWINLAKIAIVDVSHLRMCCLPLIPDNAAALLLDNVSDADEARRQRATIETLLGVPVVGWLPRVTTAREAVTSLMPGTRPDAELCRYLGEQLLPELDLDRLRSISSRPRDLAVRPLVEATASRSLTVAVAYDDAFQCYFQDSFDILESLGATLRDFSPLRGDVLPSDADVVYFGCGPVHRYARELARNCCMRETIRRYVRGGGRIYAECGGLAYLAKQLQLPNGTTFPMAGILPVAVKLAEQWQDFRPVEMILREPCWIGSPPQRLRGYLNPNWKVVPVGPVHRCGYVAEAANALVGYKNVIGSQVHVNFAANADLLSNFFLPARIEASS